MMNCFKNGTNSAFVMTLFLRAKAATAFSVS